MNKRLRATHWLQQVIAQKKSLSALAPSIKKEKDADFIHAMCYGVCRYLPELDHYLRQLLPKPLKPKDADIYCLLLIALFQLRYSKHPHYAIVDQSVEASRALGKAWASKLVNALLRRYGAERERLLGMAQLDGAAMWHHPVWLIELTQQDWPQHWREILRANLAAPPLWLRTNPLHNTAAQYLTALQAVGVTASLSPFNNMAILLAEPSDIQQLPGFAQGHFSVQDLAGQFTAELLNLQPGMRVLDACAAPGAKTSLILEHIANLDLLALEIDPERIVRLQQNVQRLNFSARCQIKLADAGRVQQWWDGRAFDRILLDAPCSGSGVIRRHPDIKLLKNLEDIYQLAQQQARLLTELWPLLRVGGMLLYCTCSILHVENCGQIAAFLTAHPDALEHPLHAPWARPLKHGVQVLPGDHGMDGFYYAALKKVHK